MVFRGFVFGGPEKITKWMLLPDSGHAGKTLGRYVAGIPVDKLNTYQSSIKATEFRLSSYIGM